MKSPTGCAEEGELRHVQIANRLVAWFSLYALSGGLITLVGWFGEVPQLTDWIGSGIPMYANTCVAAVCSSVALLLRFTRRRWSGAAIRSVSLFAGAIGALTLFEHLSQVNLGIDTLLVSQPWGERATVSPGRMGPPASVSFALLGIAIFLAAGESRARRAVPALGILVVTIPMLGITGYLFGADPLFAVAKVTGIAMQTATIVFALGLALLASVPEFEPVATLCRCSAASLLARRALPFVILLPIGFGWLFVMGREAQVVDRGMGTAILVLALIAVFCALLWWCVADVARHEQSSRRAEIELQRRNRQLATFLETAAIGLHRVGPNGTIEWANAAEMQMLGYSPEEYIGRHVAEFHTEPPVINDIMKRLSNGERLYGYEARLKCNDGSVKTVLIDSSALWEDGRFAHTQCFTRDITELKQAEEALRESEQRLRATFNQAAVGIALAELDGRFTETNQKFSDIVGYSASELRSLRVIDLTHPDDLPRTIEKMTQLKQGHIPNYSYEKRFVRKEGGWVWILATVTMIKNFTGSPQRFIGVIQDITERKRAEEGAARLAAIVEHSDDAILSTDLAGVIQSWNRGAEQLYGYPADQAIGQPLTILIPDGCQDEESEILQGIRAGRTFENYETVRRRRDGTVFEVSLTVSPVKDANGAVVGVSKVARDITEKVRARELLEQTVAERTVSLREALAQMEEFSYSVSHDLRAPLRAMSAYAGVLLEEYSDRLDETGRCYLQKIQRSSERMNRLTQDVLAYSRIARSQVQPETVDLEALVRDVICQYSSLQPPAAEMEIVSPLLNVLGHETTLGQCIANLLNNAVKFVAPGVKPRVRVRTEPAGKNVRVWFEDNGIGINPEHHKRIFQMFERLHPDGKYEGTGIGLTIVRKAVERMAGDVGVDSDGQNGSRFWIELPRAEESNQDSPAPH